MQFQVIKALILLVNMTEEVDNSGIRFRHNHGSRSPKTRAEILKEGTVIFITVLPGKFIHLKTTLTVP